MFTVVGFEYLIQSFLHETLNRADLYAVQPYTKSDIKSVFKFALRNLNNREQCYINVTTMLARFVNEINMWPIQTPS